MSDFDTFIATAADFGGDETAANTYNTLPAYKRRRIYSQLKGGRKGRDPLYSERMTTKTVGLSAKHIEIAESLGGGNVSAGIRLALESHDLV